MQVSIHIDWYTYTGRYLNEIPMSGIFYSAKHSLFACWPSLSLLDNCVFVIRKLTMACLQILQPRLKCKNIESHHWTNDQVTRGRPGPWCLTSFQEDSWTSLLHSSVKMKQLQQTIGIICISPDRSSKSEDKWSIVTQPTNAMEVSWFLP